MQDYAEEAIIDGQIAAAGVVDKAELLELIHEMTDPGPGCAEHLRKGFLIDAGTQSFDRVFLAKMGHKQESAVSCANTLNDRIVGIPESWNLEQGHDPESQIIRNTS